MDRRANKREARRRQLLDAAMAIVIEEGFEALTVARIATRLDAAVGSLYRYFPGKDALVVGLQERAIGDFHAFLEARLGAARALLGPEAAGPTGTLVQLLVGFSSYLEDPHADPSRHRLLDAFLSAPTSWLSDAQARAVDAVLAPVISTYAALLQRAVATGVLEPGDNTLRTHLMWAAVHGLDHLRKRDRVNPDTLHVERLFEATCEAVMRGWGASAELVARAIARYRALPPLRHALIAAPPRDEALVAAAALGA